MKRLKGFKVKELLSGVNVVKNKKSPLCDMLLLVMSIFFSIFDNKECHSNESCWFNDSRLESTIFLGC